MKDIDKALDDFNKSKQLIKEDISSEENLINIFSKLDDTNKEKLLTYATDLYYSHKYQTKIKEIPILDINLGD